MAFLLKPIKPKATVFNVARIEAAVRAGLKEAAEGARDDFEATTATWSRPVVFEVVETPQGYVVGTDNEIYEYVDQGTRAHEIRPRKARVLVFGVPSAAKTTPGVIGSGGGSSGSSIVRVKRVMHPGTRARNFSDLIHRTWQGRVAVIVAQRIGGALGD